MTGSKREDIKSHLALAEARDEGRREYSLAERIGDQASEAKDKFVGFAKEHPVATVAGGLVLGVAIAAMFKTPRRAAMRGGARAAGLAAIGSEIALAFASQLLDGAQEAGRGGARKLDALGDTLGDRARSLRHGAADKASDVRDLARSAGHGASRSLSRLLGRR